MSCEAVTNFVHNETGRFVVPIMERRVFQRSLWLNIIRRGEWMNGMGPSLNVLFYERSAPTEADPSWTSIQPNDVIPDGQAGGSCLPPSEKIPIASTTRNFSLERIAREGPDICNIDIMPAFDLQNQLESVAGILGDYSRILWEIKYRHEYFRLCQTKVVVDDCASGATNTNTLATTYPAACPTQPLHMAIVRYYFIDQMREGAGADALLRGAGGSPLGIMIVSNETRGNIIRQNAEIREDIRLSNLNNLLVRAFGVSHSYGDIAWLADPYPRRFSCAAGVFTEIPAFALGSNATKGQEAIVNPTWKTAADEESFLFDAEVMESLIPRPPTDPHPNFKFDPVNFTGAVTLKNIIDRTCNPDGTVIYHRLQLGHAGKPKETWRGVAFVHNRCDPMGCTLVCAS